MRRNIIIAGAVITGILIILLIQRYYGFDKKTKSSDSPIDRKIAALELKLQKNPKDVSVAILLSNAYMQKVRETADVSYYATIEDLLDATEKIDNNNADIFATRASVAAGRHDFATALTFGQKALELNPDKAHYYGIVGDAQLELGQYDKAVATIQRMMDLRPDFSAFTRVAYIRELYGEVEAATDALERGISAGSPYPENIAWTYGELGRLATRTDLDLAAHHYEQALTIVPDYPPALEGLGLIASAKKDPGKALEYFKKAFDRLPIAQYAVDRGDVYKKKGDSKKAAQQYTLAQIAFEKSTTSGVNTDLEMAYFLADHDRDLKIALEKARAAHRARPNVYAADALAWAYYKNQKVEEAQQYMKEALRLGEHIPLILFHAGMIAYKKGESEAAKRYLEKALALHPHFSLLYVSEAAETLKKL